MRLHSSLSSLTLTFTTIALVTLTASTGSVAMADEQVPDERLMAEDLRAPTRVVTLGTGTPNIVEGRAGTATAVIVNQDEVYLFDAGSGFMETLAGFLDEESRDIFPMSPSYPEFMYPTFLNKLFLTHLDSDHILGIPELLLRGWVLERNEPVRIWGPAGTRTVVDGAVAAYQPDIQHRLGSLPIGKEAPYSGLVEELASEPGLVYQDRYVTITAFDVDHGTWESGEAFGYRIEAPDKTIVISGDTRPTPNLIEHAQGADILLHEVMSTTGLETLPQEWQEYMQDAHTTTQQLANIADEIDPELLVMIHPLFLGASEATLTQEMTDAYEGNFALANDGDVFE
ncbi:MULTISPECIES: MBL fold metallo-hydrolase [unclassified Halomonas]|uniref:MBL fold metallo-hydrolase n=1 Tax=unclassified Halomonas TaxID=2609666 RepID=UPI002888F151|nr:MULTISPECIES: MBL fold metallo-hydrolase [unclassified Halomonas]MDT0502531.1 MBL fold metallo-hydrolase [Halomonas sp. PAR7]MDT0512763.1 MBL fold metallo-hydrolase [Halomonas sp. LES1]MDT0591919.1 MBL fold metallo-hydrolase [Halomonas sp. PAR8]